MCFVTIGSPNRDQSGKYTFLTWLGPQKYSAETVEKCLLEELNQLTTTFFLVYHRTLKRIVNVKLKLFVFLGDKPEGYKRLQLLQGQAYGARFGYVGDLMYIFDKIPCCHDCLHHLMNNNEVAVTNCTNCYSFIINTVVF